MRQLYYTNINMYYDEFVHINFYNFQMINFSDDIE